VSKCLSNLFINKKRVGREKECGRRGTTFFQKKMKEKLKIKARFMYSVEKEEEIRRNKKDEMNLDSSPPPQKLERTIIVHPKNPPPPPKRKKKKKKKKKKTVKKKKKDSDYISRMIKVMKLVHKISLKCKGTAEITNMNKLTDAGVYNVIFEINGLFSDFKIEEISKLHGISGLNVLETGGYGKYILSSLIDSLKIPEETKKRRRIKRNRGEKPKGKPSKIRKVVKDGKVEKKKKVKDEFEDLRGEENFGNILTLYVIEICSDLIKFKDPNTKITYVNSLKQSTVVFTQYRSRTMLVVKVKKEYEVLFAAPMNTFDIILKHVQQTHKSEKIEGSGEIDYTYKFLKLLKSRKKNDTNPIIELTSKEFSEFVKVGQEFMVNTLKKLHAENRGSLKRNNLYLMSD